MYVGYLMEQEMRARQADVVRRASAEPGQAAAARRVERRWTLRWPIAPRPTAVAVVPCAPVSDVAKAAC